VLWAVLRKYRKWLFSASRRIKSLEPINTKIGKNDYVIEITSVPSLVKIDQVDSSPHVGGVVGYRYFSSNIWLSGTRTADAGSSTPTCYISIDAVRPEECALGGFNTKKLHFWELFPQNSLVFPQE
jgi:hypothetical protein